MSSTLPPLSLDSTALHHPALYTMADCLRP